MERDDVRAAVLEAADVARAVLEGGLSAVNEGTWRAGEEPAAWV